MVTKQARSFSLARLIKRLIIDIVVGYLVIAGILWAGQELLIFPLLSERFISNRDLAEIPIPPGITSFFVSTSDGESLEVWGSEERNATSKLAAIIFHGNGETVRSQNFIGFFRTLGIPAYIFDYRGYGRSTGWPSEEGLYRDADAVSQAVLSRTGLQPSQLLILGQSLGTGPAAYLASKLQPLSLVLLSGYSDMRSQVSEMPLHAHFSYLLRYELPTAEYVSQLKSSCLVLAHGALDTTIRISNLERIKQRIPSQLRAAVIEEANAGHNDLYHKIESRLEAAVKDCLEPGAASAYERN